MAQTDSSWAITLPSFAPPVGQVMEQGVQQHERGLEKQFALQQQAKEKADADKKWQLIQNKEATDPTKYQTPQAAFNDQYNGKIADIKNQANAMIDKGATDADVMDFLGKNMTPVINLYNYGNNKLKEIDAQAVLAAKENPHLNMEEAKKVATLKWLSDIKDPTTGQPKSIDQLALNNKDYIGQEIHPQNAWKYANGEDFLSSIKKAEGGEQRTFIRKTPNGDSIIATGVLPFWAKPNVEVNPQTGLSPTGKEPKFELKGQQETFIDAQGKPQIGFAVPDDVLDKFENGSKKVRDGFNAMYYGQLNHLDPSQRPQTEHDAKIYKKQVLAQYIKDLDLNQPRANAITAAPQGRETVAEYKAKHSTDGGNGEEAVNNVINNGVQIEAIRLPNDGDKNDVGTHYKGYKEIKLDIPIADRFTPKETDEKGKLVKNPTTRWLVNEDGTKFAPIEFVTEGEKKKLTEDGKGKNIKVGDIKIPKPEDWVGRSQIAQAYKKEYPKGEGDLKTDNGKKQSSQPAKKTYKGLDKSGNPIFE